MTDKGIKKVTSKKPLALKIYEKFDSRQFVVANEERIKSQIYKDTVKDEEIYDNLEM